MRIRSVGRVALYGVLALAIPLDWFDGYRLTATLPVATVDGSAEPGIRRGWGHSQR